MTSLQFGIVRICCSRLKGNYLKKENFSQFFVPFLESTSNFKHFESKVIFIALVFPKLRTVKDLVRPLSKKRRFRAPFESQHVKGPQTFVKSAGEHLDHIISSL